MVHSINFKPAKVAKSRWKSFCTYFLATTGILNGFWPKSLLTLFPVPQKIAFSQRGWGPNGLDPQHDQTFLTGPPSLSRKNLLISRYSPPAWHRQTVPLNFRWYYWWKKSWSSWYGKISYYLQGFIHARWLAGFLNHQQYKVGPYQL